MKGITLTIDGKMHKLMDGNEPCYKCSSQCSLHDFCSNTSLELCPAETFGGEYFVELKVEK